MSWEVDRIPHYLALLVSLRSIIIPTALLYPSLSPRKQRETTRLPHCEKVSLSRHNMPIQITIVRPVVSKVWSLPIVLSIGEIGGEED
jgi:hypothetical protein